MEKGTSGNVSKTATLLVVNLSSFLNAFMVSSVSIALPAIGKEFAMNAVVLGWVATVYPLAAAAVLVPFGKIADIFGRKRLFTWGILLYTLSSLLGAVSNSAAMLLAFRVCQGIGAAVIFGTGVAILASVFPAGEKGKALGLNVATVYLGLATGPFLGGLLTYHFGWRSIFWAVVPLGLIVIAAVRWKMKAEWAGARGERFDLSGSIIYAIALVALIYGLSLLPAVTGIVVFGLGVLGLTAFVYWEKRTSSPVLDIGLFRHNTIFALSSLAALLNYSATWAVTFLLSLYLQYIKGMEPQAAGLVLVVMPAVQAVFSPAAGRLSDRIEPRVLASTGMGLNAIGLGLLIFLGQNTGIAHLLVTLAILGVGFALFSSPNTNAIMSSVESNFYGVASAIMATMRQVGLTLSLGIVTLIFSIYIGRVEITAGNSLQFLASARTAFVIFTGLCILGVFVSLARGKLRQ